jgi:hypothetical protein
MRVLEQVMATDASVRSRVHELVRVQMLVQLAYDTNPPG